jgi:hypothetical protein
MTKDLFVEERDEPFEELKAFIGTGELLISQPLFEQ